MIWTACMKDGTTILESNNGIETLFKDLDFNNVEIFSIVDSLQTFVNLDLSNGSFNLNNLDLTRLNSLLGGEELCIKYDFNSQNFKLTPESNEFLNTLILKEERINRISFDQTGKFSINGVPFYIGFEIDSLKEDFINQPPYTNIIQYRDGVTDFTGNSNSPNPYKRFDATIAYTLGYTKEHAFNGMTFNLSLLVKYDIVQKCVSINCTITASDFIKGKLYIHFGENESTLEVSLYKDEPANLTRIITLM